MERRARRVVVSERGARRVVIEQYVAAVREPLLAIRARTWQALLHALATRAPTPGQCSATESAEGINRGGSEQRERERTQSSLYEQQGMP